MFLKMIKISINFILSSTWIHIKKANLLGHIVITNNVSNNVNLARIIKSDLNYQ
jgi:hypothetical protein